MSLLQITKHDGSGQQVDRYSHDLGNDEEFVSIELRPLPDSPWLSDDPGFGTSIVSLAHVLADYPSPFTVLGVTMDMREIPFRVRGEEVIVSPRVPRRSGRLTIHGKTPKRAVATIQRASRHIPSPDDSYGLQRAVRSHALPVNRFSGQRG